MSSIRTLITETTSALATLLASGSARFVDNGDGTVTDQDTGLMWQKTDDAGGVTDKDNAYTWTSAYGGTEPNGTLFTAFLSDLNNCEGAGGHAGYCDWRLPELDELQTIVDTNAPGCDMGSACIDETIFGPTNEAPYQAYWSATAKVDDPGYAWLVAFGDGTVRFSQMSDPWAGRAVRGGL